MEIPLPILRPNALPSADTRWCRIALLLTGDVTAAGKIIQEVFAEAPEELAQLRGKEHRKHWMISKIRSRALKWRQENASPGETGDCSSISSLIAALSEPSRSAFVFFHSLEGSVEDCAHLLGMDSAAFAQALSRARKALAPGSVFPESPLLALHRPWGKDDPKIAKAVQTAQATPEFAAQVASDRQWHNEIERLSIPEDILRSAKMPKPGMQKQIFHPAVLAITLALVVIIGVAIYMAQNHMGDFPGKDVVEELVQDAGYLKDSAFEPVSATTAGKLDDWFVMKGFEGFSVPRELQNAKVLGCRVGTHEGISVAQVALEKQNAFLLVFRAADAKLDGSKTGWQPAFQQDDWAVGTYLDKLTVCVVMFQGDSEAMPKFLKSVRK